MAYCGVITATATTVPITWTNVYSSSSITSTGTLNINTTPPAAIQISNPSTNLPSVTIHHDGRVEYVGKPSEAAEAFYKALGSNINMKAAGKRALEKTYRRAIERCLNKAKSMTHEELIASLEKELDARNSKAVMMRLTEEDGDAE